MIFGIGTDIVAIERFQRYLDMGNDTLIRRLFNSAEIAKCSSRKDAASCYAARFAAKEALLKALGSGLRGGISWQDMEITNNELGRPEFLLSGKAGELFRGYSLSTVHLSLSHDGGNAIAMVVIEQ